MMKRSFRNSPYTAIAYAWKHLPSGKSGVSTRLLKDIPELMIYATSLKTTTDLILFWNNKSSDWVFEQLDEEIKFWD